MMVKLWSSTAALKKSAPAINKFLSSRGLSVYLLMAALLFYLLLAIWAAKTPAHVVKSIANVLPFKLLYGFFFLNLLFCILNGISGIRRRARKRKLEEITPEFIQGFRHRQSEEGPAPEEQQKYLESYAGQLKKARFKVKVDAANGRLWAVKNRLSPWGTLVFHAAFLLILIGFFVSLITRFEGKTVAAVGQSFNSYPQQFWPPLKKEVKAIPKVNFTVNRVTPAFWKDQLLFTNLEAEIIYPRGDKLQYSTIKINDPIFLDFAGVRLTGMGYAPLFQIEDSRGMVREGGYVTMMVFPPGMEDFFKMEYLPHTFYVQLYPDAFLVNDRPVNLSYDLKNPLFRLRIMRNKFVVFDGYIRYKQKVEFEGFNLYFLDVRPWVEVEIIRDYGIPLIFLGFIAMLVGLGWRFLFYRQEIFLALEPAADNKLMVHKAQTQEFFEGTF